MMGTTKKMQPSLFHLPILSDMVSTPPELAADICSFFGPSGRCLDPCAGNDVFFNLLPAGADWCEIERGRDFYGWSKSGYEWIISNPPYSHYAAWLRHSMGLAANIVYLVPMYKVFASALFLTDLFLWGGIVHIRRYGTGTRWGFPFGHALGAIHYQAGYTGDTGWSHYGDGGVR